MNHRDLVLAIDVGSTWCKAAYVDRAGRFVAEGRVYRRGGPPFGHGTADLEEVWDAVRRAVRRAGEQAGTGNREPQPAAVGVTAHKAPGVWLDERGEPVEPPRDSVLNAGREDIGACYSSDAWQSNDPFACGYGVDLIGNTRWLRRVHPDLWSRVQYAGTLHTWLMRRLTGRWVTSPAAGPGEDRWPNEVTELAGLPVGAFPTVHHGYEQVGTLVPSTAEDLGLPPDTPVVAGTHDGAAANLGAGAIRVNDACLTLGTNGVIRAVTGERLPRQFGYPVVTGRWAMVRDLPDLALRLDSVVAAIDGEGRPVRPARHAALTREAVDVPAGSNGLRLSLYPPDAENPADAARRALAEGYSVGTVYRAALEAVSFGFRGLTEVVRDAGATPERFLVTGGATDNKLLLTILSAALDAPVIASAREAGLLGVAVLAATGSGWYSNVEEAADRMVPAGQVVQASREETAFYTELSGAVSLPTGSAPGDHVRANR